MVVHLGSAGAFILFCCALASNGSLLEDDTTPEPVVNQLSAATKEPTDQPVPTKPAQTESPTDTPKPTPTVTATPIPSAVTAVTTNRYRGPGDKYGTAGLMNAGIPVEILAISADGQWVEVLYRSDSSWLPLTSLINVANLEAVPLALMCHRHQLTIPRTHRAPQVKQMGLHPKQMIPVTVGVRRFLHGSFVQYLVESLLVEHWLWVAVKRFL